MFESTKCSDVSFFASPSSTTKRNTTWTHHSDSSFSSGAEISEPENFIIENGTNLFSYLVKLIWKCWWCSPERDNSSFTEWMENPLDFIVKLKNNNQLSICQSFTFHRIYAFCWSFYMFSDSYIYILCSSFSLAVCIVI